MSKNAGFTMIEVIIVIAVIGVATVVAVPAYLSMLPDIRLNGAVRDLKSDLNLAKQRAIRENGQMAVKFDAVNNQYTIFLDNGVGGGIAGDFNRNGTESVLKTVGMPEGVTMSAVSFATVGTTPSLPGFSFDGRGLPSIAGDEAVRMTNTKNKFRGILMTLVGVMTIQISTDGGGSWQNVE